jgi:hypothetical protein
MAGCLVVAFPGRSIGRGPEEQLRVPQGAIFKLQLLSSISTASNKKGDKFNCLVVAPDEFKEATVEGRIARLKNGGRVGKTSEIALEFKSITARDGRTGKFGAEVMEVYEVVNASDQGRADDEGQVSGKSVRKRTLKRSLIGAGIGATIGGILGGGKGAAIGAAIGAGLGATTSLAQESPNLEFTEGTVFDVKTPGQAQ